MLDGISLQVKLSRDAARTAMPLLAYYVTDLNDESCSNIPANAQHKITVYKLCKVHVARLNAKSLVDNFRNNRTSLDCKVCSFYNADITPDTSVHEQSAFQAMSLLETRFDISPRDWLVDTFLFGSRYSSPDIYIAEYNLVIMVDGRQHFEDMQGKLASDALEIDSRFNRCAVNKGVDVLRLHYLADRSYVDLMSDALTDIESGMFVEGVRFSDHYPIEYRTRYLDVTL